MYCSNQETGYPWEEVTTNGHKGGLQSASNILFLDRAIGCVQFVKSIKWHTCTFYYVCYISIKEEGNSLSIII